MERSHRYDTWKVIAVVWGVIAVIVVLIWAFGAVARDGGNWNDTNQDIKIRQWFQKLMQPDNPVVSCCGEADAYEADTFYEKDGHYVAVITGHRGPTAIQIGAHINVPNYKMKVDAGNPTGHGIIFIGAQGQVFCFVTPAGT